MRKLRNYTITPVFLVAATVFWIHADYEDTLYDAFVLEHVTPGMPDRSKVLALMEGVHDTVTARRGTFTHASSNQRLVCVRTRLFRSGDLEFAHTTNGCGSYAGMFVEACHRADIRARLCQMRVAGKTVHILAEAYVDDRWVVVDPHFRQTFLTPEGELASFAEVSANWEYYSAQASDEYDEYGFTFEGVRYTNWHKIPMLLPAVKRILDITLGERANCISLRSYCLNVYKIWFFGALAGCMATNCVPVGMALRRAIRRRGSREKAKL